MADYEYPAEKLARARRLLMLPHVNGDAESVAQAMHECALALRHIKEGSLDEAALDRVATLKMLMSMSSLKEPSWLARARTFTAEDTADFSDAVDKLATWFQLRAARTAA